MKKIFKNSVICSVMFFTFSFICCYGSAGAKAIQSANQAQAAALKEVPSATVVEVDTDTENGELVYEVELQKGGKEYNLQYRSSDGALMKYEWELNHPPYTNQNKKNLSKQAIRKKALKQVKNATVVSTVLKYDDGRAEYKIKLKKGNKQYTLVYDSKSGKLLEYEWELAKSTASSKYIGSAKAKEIALKKVPGATVVKVEFDHDDGTAVYEVELRKGNYEYEMKINAKTGKIIEYEKDFAD